MDFKQMKERASDVSEVLKVMSHPERLFVLCQLSEGEVGVGQLQSSSNLSQSAFSQHLSVLRRARLVTIRKESQHVYYSLKDKRIIDLVKHIHSIYSE